MNGPFDPGRNPHRRSVGGRRGRILARLHTHLQKIPGIKNVRYEPSELAVDAAIVGAVETMIFADGIIPADTASVQVNWWPQDAGPDWFQVHYWDSAGYDCGWHRQENDHVEGLDHFQERDRRSEEYRYEPVTFEPTTPIGLLWDIVDRRLRLRLQNRYR